MCYSRVLRRAALSIQKFGKGRGQSPYLSFDIRNSDQLVFVHFAVCRPTLGDITFVAPHAMSGTSLRHSLSLLNTYMLSHSCNSIMDLNACTTQLHETYPVKVCIISVILMVGCGRSNH